MSIEMGIFCAYTGGTPPELIAESARAIEERGFAAIWVPEHVVLFSEYESTYPYAEDGRLPGFGNGMVDPMTALTFAAANTSRIRLGTSICLVPQRNPVYTAKQIADIDYLSGGRVNFGIGVGWLKEEFDALQVPWPRRGARTDEYLQVMKSLWCDEVSQFDGEFYSLAPCMQNPKPVQTPHPPIFVGGEGDAALRRVARHAQGWMGASVKPADIPQRLRRLETFLTDAGRRPADVSIYALPNAAPTAELVKQYEDVGVEHVIHMIPLRTMDDINSRLDRFAAML